MPETLKRPRSSEEARRPHRAAQLRYDAQLADRFRAIDACCLSRRIPRDSIRGETA